MIVSLISNVCSRPILVEKAKTSPSLHFVLSNELCDWAISIPIIAMNAMNLLRLWISSWCTANVYSFIWTRRFSTDDFIQSVEVWTIWTESACTLHKDMIYFIFTSNPKICLKKRKKSKTPSIQATPNHRRISSNSFIRWCEYFCCSFDFIGKNSPATVWNISTKRKLHVNRRIETVKKNYSIEELSMWRLEPFSDQKNRNWIPSYVFDRLNVFIFSYLRLSMESPFLCALGNRTVCALFSIWLFFYASFVERAQSTHKHKHTKANWWIKTKHSPLFIAIYSI